MPGMQWLSGVANQIAEFPRQIRYDDVGRLQRHSPVRGEAVVGDTAVAGSRIGLGDPQRRHSPAAQGADRVDGLTRLDAGEAPASTSAEVARPLSQYDDLGSQYMNCRQKPGVDVTASRSPPYACPTVTVPVSQPAAWRAGTVRENASGSAPPSVIT
jgi:hypothetical protein